jgi:alpha-beta hydrolase superfamily lysophospholipase
MSLAGTFVTIILAVFVVIVAALALAVAFGTARPPAPLAAVGEPFARVDYSRLPAPQSYAARDGATLAFRAYPGDPARIAVLVHGSAGDGASMHALATALRARGRTVYTLDVRGHGASGPRGDIGYVGQLEDDMADFVGFVRTRHPGASLALIGFSSGGGFALRVAGSEIGGTFHRYVLISPLLTHRAPTYRSDARWAAPYVPRIVALTILSRLGIHAFEGLPVLAFGVAPESRTRLVATYSFRLQQNFEPHADYLADIRRAPNPMTVLVGANDELFHADRFAPVFRSVRDDVPVTVVPGIGHVGMILEPAALEAVASALDPVR